MKNFRWFGCLAFFLGAAGCGLQSPYPDAPGTIFIRQQVCDLTDFKIRFFKPENNLKDRGFLAYRFYRDPGDPKTYLMVFECADLKKALEFIQSSNFMVACVGAGLGSSVMWAGEEVNPPGNTSLGKDDLVVARYEVKNEGDWKKLGEGRWYRLSNSPRMAIVVREVKDLFQVRYGLESPNLKDKLTADGVIHRDVWLGSYLEAGNWMDRGR